MAATRSGKRNVVVLGDEATADPGRREQDLQRHRERLMQALAAAILERGLANTQISDIVRHAKASRTTFYRCFEDKDDCFIALAESLCAHSRASVVAAVDQAAPWEQQVEMAVDAWVGLLRENHAMVVTLTNDLPMLGERGARFRAENIERDAEMLFALASTDFAKRAGVRISMDKAVMLMAGLDGMYVRKVRRGESLASLAETAKEVIKRAIAPDS